MDIRKNGYLTIISPITRNPSYMSKKGFSILHTLSVGDEDTKNLEDFSFLIDQWKRHNRNRRIFNRRINQIQLATDQQQMPYISENIRHSTTDDESEDEEEIPTNFDTLKNIQDDSNDQLTQSSQNDEVSIEIPPFALINQRNFPLIHIHRSHISQSGSLQYGHSHMQSAQHAHAQNPIHTQANQQGYRQNYQQISNTVNSSNQIMNNSNSYFQQQQQQQQQIRTNYIPRAYSTNQMQYTTATPSSSTPQPQQDESNNTIQYESFFIHSKHEQNTQQQQRAENDNRFLAMTQNQSLNPLRQINQISSQIPSTISSLGSQLNSLNNLNINGNLNSNLSSHIGSNMSNNINSNLNNTMNYLLQNRSVNIYNMMRSSTNMYQSSQPLQKHISTNQQQNQPQIIKTYFNQYAENSQWSVIWDPDQCPNIPLILDRSDRRIKFTDVNSHGNDQKRKIRKWDDMNFENKSYYSELFVSKDSRLDLNLRHSDPALNLSLIEPNLTDFENFHHPKFNTVPFISHKLKVTYKMEYDIGENGEAAISPFLKDLKSLSGRRGGVVIVEHTSEALPFIMNVGMASRLIIYWHKATPNDNPKTNVENMHILEPDQTAPFIAQIPRNESVPSINCLLYSVPVAEHKVEMTDFLLIKSVRKPIFYIRKFKSIYCAGFLEPHQVVMRPATKTAQDFHLVFIKAILINIFRGTEQYPGRKRIQVSQLQQEFFPGVNEPKLRQVLRTLAKYKRKQGNVYWKRRNLDFLHMQFKAIEITPELVCRYQSMLVGQYKLRQNGVNILTRSKRVFQQIQNLHGELTRKVANKIEVELMKTPWARTENFTKAFQGHAVQIEHADDGSQIMRSKSRRGKNDTINGKEPEVVAKPKLAGTDKDLRSLTLRELREKLIQLGVSQQVIDETSRWKLVDLLRQLANRQKQDGNTSELTQNYSRGPRNDYAASLDAYKKQYQATFENNLSFINTSNPTESDELLDDGNILDDISLQMMRDDRDDEDNEESFELPESEEPVHGSHDDPQELVPFGIFTYPTKIEWDKLGFINSPMRTVAKLITISWNRLDGLHIDVHWRRSPPQIESLMRNTASVYPDPGQKAPSTSEDLEEFILKNQHKTLLDKVRRTRQAIRSRGAKTLVQSYLAVHHQVPLINDTGGNNLTFHLTPEIVQKIAEASERFAFFEQKNGRSHSKKKKSSGGGDRNINFNNNNNNSDDDDDDTPEIIPQRRIGRQNPVVLFNELLKKLLAKLLQRPGDEFWPFKKPVLKKDVPDYHNIIHNPICFEDIERKANNLEYTTVSKFYSDVKLIETNCKTYNMGRNDDLVALSARMITDFQKEFSAVREELGQLESEIDPVLRQNQE